MSDRRRKRQGHREDRREAAARPATAARPAWPIAPGWKVYTSDSETLGRVGEAPAGEPYFTVRRGLLFRAVTLYVPLRLVRGSSEKEGGYVLLRATKHEALSWRHAPTGRREQPEPATSETGAAEVAAPRPSPDMPSRRASRAVQVKRRQEVPSIPIRELYRAQPEKKSVAATEAPTAVEAVTPTVEKTRDREPMALVEDAAPPVLAPDHAGEGTGPELSLMADQPGHAAMVESEDDTTGSALEDAALRRFSERVHEQEVETAVKSHHSVGSHDAPA